MTPLNNNIIVKRIPVPEKSSGGIVLPGNDEKPTTGTVISSSVEELSTGDIILFGKYAGKELRLNTEDVLILKFSEVLAKL